MQHASQKHQPATLQPASQREEQPRSGSLSVQLAQSPRQAAQRRQLQDLRSGPVQRAEGLGKEEDEAGAAQLRTAPAQRQDNRTGMPDSLKAGIESLSGMDMSDVRVHRNSSQSAQLNALAYAQGNDIHLGPGQEQHLPHEAWHVVQQRQGRVQATMQMARVGVNDDEGLEREADVMGGRAGQSRTEGDKRKHLTLNPLTPNPRKAGIESLASASPAPVHSSAASTDLQGSPRQVAQRRIIDASFGDRDATPTPASQLPVQLQDEIEPPALHEQRQEQVLVGVAPPEDPTRHRQAVRLERRAIDLAEKAALLKEDLDAAEGEAQLLDAKSRFTALCRSLGAVVAERKELARSLAAGGAAPDDATHALETVAEICRELRNEADAFWRRWAERMHGPALDRLAESSTSEERSQVPKRPRSPLATAEDVREINNWVSGGWGSINQYLFGTDTDEDRATRAFVLAHGQPKDRWAIDVDARVSGIATALEKLPSFQGTTYRQARCKDADVYRRKIGPGSFVSSPGFLATSHVKGAEGAGGGEDGWGRGDRVYFQVTGATGVDLGPYQENLKGEREVLYPTRSVFEVLAVRVVPRGTGGDGKPLQTVLVILQQVLAVPDDVTVLDSYSGEPLADAPVDLT